MDKPVETVTLNIEPFLGPIAMIISATIIAAGFIIGSNNLKGSVTTGGTTITANTGGDTTTTTQGVTADPKVLTNLASAIGVDSIAFQSCLTARETENDVKADTAAGSSVGVTGTPGFVIGKLQGDGSITEAYVFSGALPADVFKNIVDGIADNNVEKINGVKAQYPRYITENVTSSIDDSDPFLGDKGTAKVAIVEYTDFDCSFCQRHHNDTYPTILRDLISPGKAIYVIRDFPLSIHNPSATTKAVAAKCVNKIAGSSKYFEYVDGLFK